MKTVKLQSSDLGLTFDLTNNRFFENVPNSDVARHLKGVFSNNERFIERYVEPNKDRLKYFNGLTDEEIKQFKANLDGLVELFEAAKPYSYKEAFEIEDEQYRAVVFGSVDIAEMVNELGGKRINTAGKELNMKQYDKEGNYLGTINQHNIYEVYEVDSTKLGGEENLYAVKCWCTTTNKEHFIWIEKEYKDDPLTAIASTFRVHENVIPHITEIKRQGDILLVETSEDVTPAGNIVPLTSEQYFGFLTAQS
jgi:hypothetical protein